VKRSIKEDWALLPFLITRSAGAIVSVVDFIILQNFRFQVYGLVGVILSVIGTYLRLKALSELKKKARFKSLASTGRLQVVEGHQLVKDGLYRHIRHPVYLGEIIRDFGFVMVFSSLYGVFLVAIATTFLLFRIEIEEKMLIEAFGEEYKEYQKNTKKLIPYIY
jgi:protein-S-isoprenylcysteine O-methyltransferase Ste14